MISLTNRGKLGKKQNPALSVESEGEELRETLLGLLCFLTEQLSQRRRLHDAVTVGQVRIATGKICRHNPSCVYTAVHVYNFHMDASHPTRLSSSRQTPGAYLLLPVLPAKKERKEQTKISLPLTGNHDRSFFKLGHESPSLLAISLI